MPLNVPPTLRRFDMTKMEACMGGMMEGSLYKHDEYGLRMEQFDRDVDAAVARAGEVGSQARRP